MSHEPYSFQLPEQASTLAPEVDWLYDFIYWFSLISFVLIVGLMVFFIFRYRRRPGVKAAPTGHNTALELAWTFAPLILLVMVFHWGFRGYVYALVVPDNAIEIRVRAEQWKWEFEYPNGRRENGVLVVPINRPVRLVMSSKDVIHSFFVPSFRVKKDAVPGMYTTLWFQATKLGEFDVFCTEYCGTSHSGMLAKIRVVGPEEEWPPRPRPNPGESPADWGRRMFAQNNCNTCHSLDGSRIAGPSFKGLWGRQETLVNGQTVEVDANYVRESILQPQAKVVAGYSNVVMPTFAGALNDEQIDAMIEFIKTVR